MVAEWFDWPWFIAGFLRDELYYQFGAYKFARPPFPTKFLSPTGLALSCDAYGGTAYVMGGQLPLIDWSSYAAIPDRSVIWTRVEALPLFTQKILPQLESRFVLVTGESDWSVPSSFPEAAEVLINSGKLIHWFTVNYDGAADNDMFTPMPIGIEYPKRNEITLDFRYGSYRAQKMSPARHERIWARFAQQAPPLEERLPLAVADFHFHNTSANRRFGESREDILAKLRDNPNIVWPERRRMSPMEPRERYARHAFVIVTYGRGLDGHRTWEALQLGCIVIVKKGPLDLLYEGLPVVSVSQWEEITPENMRRWFDMYGPDFDRGRVHTMLSLSHWTEKIRAKVRRG